MKAASRITNDTSHAGKGVRHCHDAPMSHRSRELFGFHPLGMEMMGALVPEMSVTVI